MGLKFKKKKKKKKEKEGEKKEGEKEGCPKFTIYCPKLDSKTILVI